MTTARIHQHDLPAADDDWITMASGLPQFADWFAAKKPDEFVFLRRRRQHRCEDL